MIKEIFNKLQGDKVIWLIVIFLSLISLLAVYSSTGILALRNNNEFYAYILKHFIFICFGFGVIYLTHKVNYKHYANIARIAFWLGIPLLVFTLFFGAEVNDASRWVRIPGTQIQFQSSDIAKLILLMYLARQLSITKDKIGSFKEAFLPAIIPILIYVFLILPENFSTAALIGFVGVILMFIGGIDWKQIFGVGSICAIIIVSVFLLAVKFNVQSGRIQTWKNRIEAFSGKDLDSMLGNNNVAVTIKKKPSSVYDIEQSDYAQIAVASAGIAGKGPGGSTQRNFLPHPYSDFIYAIIIEEYGWLGAVIIVVLYLTFLYRGIRIVLKSQGSFGALLAGGLTLMLVIQAFIHMAVNVHLLPTTGQTLPLVSMGGTSIIFTAASVGIILSVSRHANNVTTQTAHE